MDLDAFLTDLGLSDTTAANRLGVSSEAIRLWRRGKRQVPAERAVQIETELGVPRHVTRPDLWPAEAAQ